MLQGFRNVNACISTEKDAWLCNCMTQTKMHFIDFRHKNTLRLLSILGPSLADV